MDATLGIFPEPLRRADLPIATVDLARWLIGKTLVHVDSAGAASGRIVETEAYVVGDASSHAFRGPTKRNASMFLPPGHAYVYFIYGCWFALNVSAESEGVGAGVLIRALEPIEGLDLMARRRGATSALDLARGPGRLAMAMGIDRSLDGLNLLSGRRLWLGYPLRQAGPVGTSVRIGITKDVHSPLRFFERGSRYVSGPGRLRQ